MVLFKDIFQIKILLPESVMNHGTIATIADITFNSSDIVLILSSIPFFTQPEVVLAFHNAALAFFSEIFASRDASRQTVDELADTAKKAGVSQDVASAFKKVVKGNSYGKWTTAGTNAFEDKKRPKDWGSAP